MENYNQNSPRRSPRISSPRRSHILPLEEYLNYDELFYIFEYLNYDEMKNMCYSNNYYRNFCQNPLIQKLMLDKYIDELNINNVVGKSYREISNYNSKMYDVFHNEILLNHVVIIKELLKRGYDPSINDNILINEASSLGRLEIVKILVQHPHVSPLNYRNKPVNAASSKGHIEVVRFLIQDPRVDQSINYNEAIKLARVNKYPEIVKLLLSSYKTTSLNKLRFN